MEQNEENELKYHKITKNLFKFPLLQRILGDSSSFYRSMGVKGARKPLPLGMGMKCRPFFR
jgi:hypothetical protein